MRLPRLRFRTYTTCCTSPILVLSEQKLPPTERPDPRFSRLRARPHPVQLNTVHPPPGQVSPGSVPLTRACSVRARGGGHAVSPGAGLVHQSCIHRTNLQNSSQLHALPTTRNATSSKLRNSARASRHPTRTSYDTLFPLWEGLPAREKRARCLTRLPQTQTGAITRACPHLTWPTSRAGGS
ncbi:hypothetical protein CALVIDRAFT_327321 [Calocera viscosa TUFC12733]|uniref:Uncharacterized protein n=1 Tax=Calocera viscosa (strain TUFC12733) TaxID=1330018 RepID=A0A167QVP9_CALVF|nr:hypothetical protein CALVIDRAFT_327321 [Calocera viscosa TUFC12733]